jgi:hypothetical protein
MDVQDVFGDLCQEIAFLHAKWRFYLDLFTSPDDVGFLNELALMSFQIIEESLRSDITMAICRLSDPAKSPGQQNLSVAALVDKLPHIDGLDALRQDFDQKCQPVRKHRNKRVAHNDLRTALKPSENPLPNIGRLQIDSILSSAARLMSHVYQWCVEGELRFEPIGIGDGKDLLHWLRSAKGQEDREVEALRGGKV